MFERRLAAAAFGDMGTRGSRRSGDRCNNLAAAAFGVFDTRASESEASRERYINLAAAAFGDMGTRGSQRSLLALRARQRRRRSAAKPEQDARETANVPCGITPSDGGIERTPRRTTAGPTPAASNAHRIQRARGRGRRRRR